MARAASYSICCLVSAVLVGCGGVSTVSQSPHPAVVTPSPSPPQSSCFYRLRYAMGTVAIEFVNRMMDCTTIQRLASEAAPPLDGLTIPLANIDRGSQGPVCYRDSVVIGGQMVAEVIAIYSDGSDTITASRFCRSFVGVSSPN